MREVEGCWSLITTTRPIRVQLPGWLLLNVGALGLSLAHTFVHYHIGLYGESQLSISLLQATNVAVTSLVVAWWVVCLDARAGTVRAGLSGALTLAVVWAFLANGLAAVVAVPPPSGAFPLQDIAHLLSIVFGALAAITTWRELKRSEGAWSWR
jgi:hypothetical protein